jgi:methyl-accepting chemotaxis protein
MGELPIGDIVQGGLLTFLAFLIVWERIKKGGEPEAPPEVLAIQTQVAEIDSRSAAIETNLDLAIRKLTALELKYDELTRKTEEISRTTAATNPEVSKMSQQARDIKLQLQELEPILREVKQHSKDTFDLHNVFRPGSRTPRWYTPEKMETTIDKNAERLQTLQSQVTEIAKDVDEIKDELRAVSRYVNPRSHGRWTGTEHKTPKDK